MFSFMNAARTLLAKFVSFIYSAVCLTATGVSASGEMPKAPKDFKPVLRFMVCSDIHINGEEGQKEPGRFIDAVTTAYAYAGKEDYPSLDAVCIAGDFTDEGSEKQYAVFKECVKKSFRDGTQLIICAGNHEYIDCRENRSEGEAYTEVVYQEQLKRPLDEHFVINGYHFITFSPDTNGETYKTKMKWADGEIKKAIDDTGDRPVFVMQHAAPKCTIYGSLNWGRLNITTMLNKYPQVVDFSGHSHYPMNDPRSIYQNKFTALGCGTLSYFETDLDCIAGNYPYDYKNAAQFYIVEADEGGNIRVLPYDLITGQFFENDYYLTGLADKNFDYTYNKMKKRDSKPVFDNNTNIGTALNSDGETVLTFDGAKSGFVTESYKISVARNGIIPVTHGNFSGKYMYLYEDDVYEMNLGKLKSGKSYTVKIKALNAYAQTSETLTFKFTAE